MASSLSRIWRYDAFASFHGPDVRKTVLSHLRKQFSHNGISMFDDQGIERSHIIAPELTRAIRDSRISIVLFTERFASSSWCLDELLEILKCREEIGQIVMTVYYGVDPSHVRKQTGEFGLAFNKMCAEKTNEERRKWIKALAHAGNIAGEDFKNWNNEAEMIEKIAKDVLDKLNATPSSDFDGMIGLDAHLMEIESLLDLGNEEVKMVAITGPTGIGKTTIARASQCLLSERFQLTCFVDNLIGSYPSGFDEYDLKLRLQEEFLSKILNHNGLTVNHLGAIKDNLCDVKVLIIIDDVKDIKQLEALANETIWFGPGSRIVVTTENKELLQQHGINVTYHVGFPSDEQAFNILCMYAFKQSYPPIEFKELAESMLKLCGKLPSRLREVGSHFRGKKKDEWEDALNRLQTSIDGAFEDVVRISYKPSPPNKAVGKSKSRCFIGMAFLVVINLLLEIASAVADQLSSIRKPNFARVSLVMSFLSVVLSILDLTLKIQAHKARFQCKWRPVPWFYYPELNYQKIFGSFIDTVLLFCVVGQLIVSGINWYFMERGQDGPIKISVWPLFFATGMVVSEIRIQILGKTDKIN